MNDPTCAYCDKPGNLARDHVIPRSRGGPDNAKNVVMACKSCNSSKSDKLPSEWLGAKCPSRVLMIELKQQLAMKKGFEQRDRKRKPLPKFFAFTTNAAGATVYVGEVKSEKDGIVMLATTNAFLLMGGLWNITGEIVRVPATSCRFFDDADLCVIAAHENGERFHRTKVTVSA